LVAVRQAKDLLRAARRGDPAAVARVRAVSDRPTLAAAQLALAREHGFASWPRLKAEVTRRAILDGRDLARLAALLAEDPAQATARLEHRRDHPKGASPLGYVAMLRYDTARGVWRDVAGASPLARALLATGWWPPAPRSTRSGAATRCGWPPPTAGQRPPAARPRGRPRPARPRAPAHPAGMVPPPAPGRRGRRPRPGRGDPGPADRWRLSGR
jgi:hypothetical protein